MLFFQIFMTVAILSVVAGATNVLSYLGQGATWRRVRTVTYYSTMLLIFVLIGLGLSYAMYAIWSL